MQLQCVKFIDFTTIFQGLQRSGLLDVLMIVEPECEMTYRNMIQDSKQAYLQR